MVVLLYIKNNQNNCGNLAIIPNFTYTLPLQRWRLFFTIMQAPKHTAQGFTLLEILITVTIIGILASIAVSSYQNFIKKTKFTEVILALNPYKTALTLCYEMTGALTDCSNGINGVPAASTANAGLVASGTGWVGLTSALETEVWGVAITGNGLNGEVYRLRGIASAVGAPITWYVHPTSTCLSAQIC